MSLLMGVSHCWWQLTRLVFACTNRPQMIFIFVYCVMMRLMASVLLRKKDLCCQIRAVYFFCQCNGNTCFSLAFVTTKYHSLLIMVSFSLILCRVHHNEVEYKILVIIAGWYIVWETLAPFTLEIFGLKFHFWSLWRKIILNVSRPFSKQITLEILYCNIEFVTDDLIDELPVEKRHLSKLIIICRI